MEKNTTFQTIIGCKAWLACALLHFFLSTCVIFFSACTILFHGKFVHWPFCSLELYTLSLLVTAYGDFQSSCSLDNHRHRIALQDPN